MADVARFRMVFVGAIEFSRQCLQEMLACGAEVVAVITLDVTAGKVHADYVDLAADVATQAIPVHHIQSINAPETLALLRTIDPDVICVFGWSQLVSRAVLEIPRVGCLGAHPTLLPQHRGRHPLIWSLVEGLDEGGLTFFFLNDEADSGDIVWQQSCAIGLHDDARSLYDRIVQLGRAGIRAWLPQLQQGTLTRRPQDHAQATYWPKRCAADGEIHWEQPTVRIHNLIRALTHPYPGAHTYNNGHHMIVWRSELPQDPLPEAMRRVAAGTVMQGSNGVLMVRTGDHYLRLVDYQHSNGERVHVGEQLGISA